MAAVLDFFYICFAGGYLRKDLGGGGEEKTYRKRERKGKKGHEESHHFLGDAEKGKGKKKGEKNTDHRPCILSFNHPVRRREKRKRKERNFQLLSPHFNFSIHFPWDKEEEEGKGDKRGGGRKRKGRRWSFLLSSSSFSLRGKREKKLRRGGERERMGGHASSSFHHLLP